MMSGKDAISESPSIAFFFEEASFLFFIFTAGGASAVRKNMSEMLTHHSGR